MYQLGKQQKNNGSLMQFENARIKKKKKKENVAKI